MKTLSVLILCLLSAIPAFSQTRAEQDRFREAEGRFGVQNYGAALSLYDSFLAAYPLSRFAPDAYFRKGVCLYRLERYEDADRVFGLVETRYTATRFLSYLPFWRGLVLFEMGRYAEAAGLLDTYLSVSLPGQTADFITEAGFYAGRAYHALGMRDDTIRTLSLLMRYDGPQQFREPGLLLLASQFLAENSPEKALEILEGLVAEGVEGHNALLLHLYMGEAFFSLGRFFEAEVMYREVVDSSSLYPDPEAVSLSFQRLFGILEFSGRGSDRENLIFQAEKLLSPSPSVLMDFWLAAGVDYYRQDRYDLAASYFRRVIALESAAPVPVSAYLYLANAYEKQEQPRQAVLVLEEGLNKNAGTGADAGELVLKLGEMRTNMGMYEEAVSAFGRYLSDFSGNGEKRAGAGYSLGFCLITLKRHEEAERVLSTALSQGPSPEVRLGILRLLTIAYSQTGKIAEYKKSLETLIALSPSDTLSRLDYISQVFSEGNYSLAVEQIEALKKTDLSFATGSVKLAYLEGLSRTGLKQYEKAFSALRSIGSKDSYALETDRSFVENVYPDLLYYRGWNLYRLTRFKEAEKEFSLLLKTFPGYGRGADVLYFAGWSAYSFGDYSLARDYFRTGAERTGPGARTKESMFMEGKSLAAMKEYTRAAVAFRTLALRFPSSDLALDALFEEAGIAGELGKAEESAALYFSLFESLSKTVNPLREESLYRRGEVLFQAGKYERARNAFYDYRLQFPNGTFIDAALYWGGVSSANLNEDFAALLLWERIAAERKESPFRPEALRRLGAIYKSRQEYRKAVEAYREVVLLYPETAAAYRLSTEIAALELILKGSTEEEAGLRAAVAGFGGVSAVEGRKAMINLARYLLPRGTDERREVQEILREVIEAETASSSLQSKDVLAAGRYLLGEFYFRGGDLKNAADQFFEAASLKPGDVDFSAGALYRAAEILLDAGYRADAADIVDVIAALYPGSLWESEGRRLLRNKQ